MTNCTQESFEFPVCKRRHVEVNLQGGDITSDGGVLLLQQLAHQLGLSEVVVGSVDDPRRQASCDHDGLSLLRQRVYALALGYVCGGIHLSSTLKQYLFTILYRYPDHPSRQFVNRDL